MKRKEYEKEMTKAPGRTREIAALGGTRGIKSDHRV